LVSYVSLNQQKPSPLFSEAVKLRRNPDIRACIAAKKMSF